MSNRSQQDNDKKRPQNNEAEDQVGEEEALAALMNSAQKRIEEQKRSLKPDSSQNKTKRQKSKYQDEGKQSAAQGKSRWGKPNETVQTEEVAEPKQKELANFGLSGALAKDTQTGNMYNGVLLKFTEPPEARTPNTRWRLYVFRDGKNIETLHISRQSAYLFGREKAVADILVEHPSLSRQHCVLQYRAVPDKSDSTMVRCKPYLMDLGSAHGTFINGERLQEARYYELRKKDVIKLGASTREYILLTEYTS